MKRIFILILTFVPLIALSQIKLEKQAPKAGSKSPVVYPTEIKRPAGFAISKPLRDAPVVSEIEVDDEEFFANAHRDRVLNPNISPPDFSKMPEDPNEQTFDGWKQNAKATVTSFEGIGSGSYPPDCNGEVNSDYFFETVNVQYQIFDKTGTTVAGPSNLNTIFDPLLDGAGCNNGDPIVLWDEQAGRWFYAEFSLCEATDYMLIAVSQSSDPTGSWYSWSYDVDDMPDYMKFGIWQDGYYMSTNTSGGNDVYVFERSKMLTGDAGAQMIAFTNPNRPSTFDGFHAIMPLDNDGAWAPAGTPAQFITIADDGQGNPADELWIYELVPDWTTPSNSTFQRVQQLPVNAFSGNFDGSWDNIPQPGTTVQVDGISTVLMFRAVYRNFGTHQTIVCNHTIAEGTEEGAIRWYELRNTGSGWSINQQGTWNPGGTDGVSRWNGAISVNSIGQIGLIYSVSDGTSIYPSIRYTGQTTCAPANTMDIAETSAWTGTASQTGANRWGDYTALAVDPADGITFWNATEYVISSPGTKGTRVTAFTIDESCNPPSLTNVSPTSLFKDRGKQITITGSDLLGCTFEIGGITGSISSNDGSTAIIDFPAGDYANGTLTVTNSVGSDTETVTIKTRTTIPVDASTGANTDIHPTIDSAVDGLHAWLGTSAFTAPYIIDVVSGTYTEGVSLNSELNPTATNTLTIQNNGAAPLVDASGNAYGFDLSTVDYVILKGFDIHSASDANVYLQGDNNTIMLNKLRNAVSGSGIKLENGSTNTVRNNLITGNYSYGIHTVASSSNVIKNNTCDNNGGSYTPLTGVTLFDYDVESGDYTGWTTTGTSPNTWQPYDDAAFANSPTFSFMANQASVVLTYSSVDITGYDNLTISAYARSDGNLEPGDALTGQYSFDNATWTDFFSISNDNPTYTQYSATGITKTSNTLYIRFDASIGGSEWWHVDDILVTGDETIAAFEDGDGIYIQSGTANVLQNNIFVAKAGNDAYYALTADVAIDASSDFNTYFSANTNTFDYLGSTDNTGPGETNQLTSDPLFVGGGDYHLQSTIGSYTASKAPIWPPDTESGGVWSADAADSPSLTGNSDPYTNEPEEDGNVINRGVYGNTAQASKGPPLPCTYPITQASAFNVSIASSSSLDLSWTRGNGSEVIIVAHAASAVDADPADGTDYTANAAFGSGSEIGTGNFVVYIGTATTTTVTGLTTGTTYHFAIYENNTPDNCYLTPAVTANGTPTASAPAITNVSPGNFFADKGKQLTITGTDLSGATVDIAGVAGTIDSNDGSTLVVTFPPALYTNNTLTVSTGVVPDATATVTVNTRNIIPVGGGTDPHTTIQSALDGLSAWFGTAAFNTSTAGYLSGAKTIDVYNGTYTNIVTPNVNLGTTATENLIIQNHTGEQPAIDASGNTNGVYIGALDYVQLIGFSVSGATGANIYTEGDNNMIRMNKSHGSTAGSGILLNGANSTTLLNNLVYNNNQFGVRIISSDNCIVDNNTIADNGNEAKAPPLPSVYEPAQLYVESGTGTAAENNIFYSKSGSYVFALKTESGVSIASDYNTYFKNGNNYLVNYNGSVYTDMAAWTGNGAGANDIESDPDFVNAGTDYHIKSTWGSYPYPAEWPPEASASAWNLDATNSPALDTGNPADAFANEPLSGGRINQGAYGNTAQASKSASTDIYWDGSTSTDWQDVTNWTPEQIPTAFDNAFIPDLSAASDRYPIVDDGTTTAVCNNLTIEAYTSGNMPSVTIATNGQMTVSGTITNNNGADGIIIKSDAAGDGSLIQNNAGISATVERYLNKETGEAGQWHFLGSPVDAAPVSLFNTNNFYYYDETADDWWTGPTYFWNDPSGWQVPAGNLNVAEGYIYYYYETTLNFQGTLNYNAAGYTGSVSYTEHAGNAANGDPYTNFDGWKLFANPFQSALDWLEIDKSDDIGLSVYYYDDAVSNYKYYIDNGDGTGDASNGGSRYIPYSQGFFVKTDDNIDGGNLSIPLSARIHDDQEFWKSPKLSFNGLRMKVEHGGYSDELLIRISQYSNKNYERKYDAYKRFSWSDEVPQIYTLNPERNTSFAINTLNFDENIIRIPIGYKMPEAGSYALMFTENTLPNTFMFMENLQTGAFTELTEDEPYTIEASDTEIQENELELVLERNQKPEVTGMVPNQTTFVYTSYSFDFPENLFYDANEFDNLTIKLTLADGSPLPENFTFDSENMNLSGMPETPASYDLLLSAFDRFGEKAEITFRLDVKDALSLSEQKTKEIAVFPVPAKDAVFVSVGGYFVRYNLSVKTVTGREVFKANFDNSSSNKIDLSNISGGVYFLKITFSDRSEIVRKIVIE